VAAGTVLRRVCERQVAATMLRMAGTAAWASALPGHRDFFCFLQRK